MASPEAVSPQQAHASRRRGTAGSIKEVNTEDHALNQIAKEAELRLAAKRAARAEARSIRMKEIEREQKGGDEDDDDEPPPSPLASSDVEITPPSSREKRLSIKMPRDREGSISSTSSLDMSDAVMTPEKQVVQLKATIKDAEDKYKKAMVNNAQLDNERQALQYQVEILKDSLEDYEEKVFNLDDELLHKSREYNKLKFEFQTTSAELDKCMYLLGERERILDEHGINFDGSFKEGYGNPECSSCSVPLNDLNSLDSFQDRGSLLAEIESLRCELADIRQSGSLEQSRNELRPTNEHVELDQSFADVSSEAAVIRDDALHTGLYVNNNEKNDDFELIDDNSQQGGMRHFEDQSFEKSTSSMTSSVTDTATSIESSLPLEINMDGTGKSMGKDDFDIVDVGSNNKSADINVDSYTTLDYGSSVSSSSGGGVSLSLNVNKYLFDDQEDTLNEDSEESTALSVSRYFAAETPSGSVESTPKTSVTNELNGSVDTITNVQSDYDTIEREDVYTLPSNQGFSEDNRDSPYEDVQEVPMAEQPKPSDEIVIIEETRTSEDNSFDETYVESSDVNQLNENEQSRMETKSDDFNMTVYQTHVDTDFTVPSTDSVDVISPTKLSPRESEETIVMHTDPSEMAPNPVTNFDIDNDSTLNSAPITVDKKLEDLQSTNEVGETASVAEEEADQSKDEMDSAPPGTSNANTNDTQPLLENTTIRNDVEELYNQIAEETNDSSITTDGLLSDKSDMNVPEPSEVSVEDVVLESKTTTPDVSVFDIEPNASSEVIPKAKERKSKKKKKKNEKVTSVNVQEADPDTPVPSDPLLLGFAKETETFSVESGSNHTDTLTRKHSPKSTTGKHFRPKSDIPKQFLDASVDLIGTSGSDLDLSDLSDGYVSDDEKRKSSKRTKKDGCKSQ